MSEAAFQHRTVLRDETRELLSAGPGKVFLDGTLGGGGHAEALLEAGASVIGLDKDPRALSAAGARLEKFGERFRPVHSDFREAREVLDALHELEIDGALVDLGVSSPQLDDPSRGFSFRAGGPLDMRMDPSRGKPLGERLQEWDQSTLANLIFNYGEERLSRPIAKAILRARDEGRLTDTAALAEVIAQAIPKKAWPKSIHPATKTFQALRIAVNDELGALEAWLASLPKMIKRGGRAAAISFHSLEDRMVKQEFARLGTGCICPPALPICACGKTAEWRVLTRGAVMAGEAELEANPRSRSARLRAVERLR